MRFIYKHESLSKEEVIKELANYGIKIPDEEKFLRKIEQNENHDKAFKRVCITPKVIEAIIKTSERWRKYIVDFDELVLAQIQGFYRLNCSVVNTLPNFNSYVGRKAELRKDAILPKWYYATIITQEGDMYEYNAQGALLKIE